MSQTPDAERLQWRCRHYARGKRDSGRGDGRDSVDLSSASGGDGAISLISSSIPHEVTRGQLAAETGTSARRSNKLTPPGAKTISKRTMSLGLLTHNNVEVVKRINCLCLPVNYGVRFYSTVIENRELARLAYVCDIPVGAICCRLAFDEDDRSDDPSKDYNVPSAGDGGFSAGECSCEKQAPSVASPSCIDVSRFTLVRSNQWELTAGLSRVAQKRAPGSGRLCILTLGVLAAYRRSGIGTMLVEWAIERCRGLSKGMAEAATGPIPGVTLGGAVDIKEVYLHVWTENYEALKFYERLGFQQKEIIQHYYQGLTPDSCIILVKSL